MKRIEKAVSDSGPLMHLSQVGSLGILKMFKEVMVPPEVMTEVCIAGRPGEKEVRASGTVKVKELTSRSKDISSIISEKYCIGLGEAESIALAKQERVELLLTDDLEARLVAKNLGLQPHGTVGIILMAFRNGVIDEEKAVGIVRDIHGKSTLYITSDLIKYIISEIRKSGKARDGY